MPRPLILILALLLAVSAVSTAVAAPSAPPERLWVGWLDGHSIEDAMATGAVLLDRFPDAVVLADAASATRLADAGYRVEPPLALPAGRTVTLLRTRAASRSAAELDAKDFESNAAVLLWRGGRDAIAVSDGPLAEVEPLLALQRQALRSEPLRSRAGAAPAGKALATDFAPVIQSMVDQVSGPALIQEIGNLAGVRPVTIGAGPVTFTTRSTPTAQCDLAEQYVFERFQALGFSDVQYDPYSFSSTSARNVVATLPGATRPGRVVILGAHLDSTSPQSSTLAPGANDNASGIAGLLLTAAILKQYSFDATLRFIAFTGEEQGLYGSTHYANAAAARGDTIVGAVIYDMIAWHGALNQIDIEGETAWLPIMNVMNDACARYTGLATQIQLFSFGSDHVPFQNVGYPSFLAIESEYDSYPCYHQTCDSTGWNQPVFGADVTRAGLATVAQLAGVRDLFISHTPLASTENTAGPYEVVATIAQLAPLVADSLELHWSNGGPFVSTTLLPTGVPDQYHAFIPGQPATTRVQYWLSAKDEQDHHATHPTNAPATLHTFFVGTRATLFTEGFESGGVGWTHGGAADDWQIASPSALGGDPAAAYAGTKVAGNDLTGLGIYSGKYENLTDSWFESPAVNCSTATAVRLSFARWLGVERSNGSLWDYARVLVNGTKVWESPPDANLIETGWSLQDLDISALADGRPAVKVRFTLKSDASITYGGWNLDELRVSGINTTVTADAPAVARPGAAVLYAAAPNPGGPGTALRFDLPRAGVVELTIYDVRGRRVRTLARGPREAGLHRLVWDGRGEDGAPSAAGVYFYRLSTPDGALSRKLVFMR